MQEDTNKAVAKISVKLSTDIIWDLELRQGVTWAAETVGIWFYFPFVCYMCMKEGHDQSSQGHCTLYFLQGFNTI